MSAADRLNEDLTWLITMAPGLAESRIRGTRLPWRPGELDARDREARDREARAEMLERSGSAPGEHPSPVHEHLVELLADLLVDAERLADELSRAAYCPTIAPPSSGLRDPRPYLRHALACAGAAAEDRALIGWAAAKARRMVASVSAAVGEVYVGQRLDAVCPWCRGVTPETPAGGAHTWRVRELPGGMTAIVCEGMCEPPLREVGTWWRGQPCWPVHEWDWLARRIEHAEGGAA